MVTLLLLKGKERLNVKKEVRVIVAYHCGCLMRTVGYINWQRAGSGSRRWSGQKSTGSLHCIIIDYKKSINIQLS